MNRRPNSTMIATPTLEPRDCIKCGGETQVHLYQKTTVVWIWSESEAKWLLEDVDPHDDCGDDERYVCTECGFKFDENEDEWNER